MPEIFPPDGVFLLLQKNGGIKELQRSMSKRSATAAMDPDFGNRFAWRLEKVLRAPT